MEYQVGMQNIDVAICDFKIYFFIYNFKTKSLAKRELQKLVVEEKILSKICIICGEKVMLDGDLAGMYGVEIRVLNQSIKRNLKRFPKDSMFRWSEKEYKNLISQKKFDIKLGRYKKTAQCFYRTGSSNVIKCIKQRDSHRSKHQDYMSIYKK